MIFSKYQCLNCRQSNWQIYSTLWRCGNCSQQYPCVKGIPKLYIESSVGQKDRELRDYFYNSLLGTYYQSMMPFLSLPVRPARAYWKGWVVYALIVVVLLAVICHLTSFLFFQDSFRFSVVNVGAILLFVFICYFIIKHPYFFFLIVLAIPVRLSILLHRFRPVETFAEVHSQVIQKFLDRKDKLQILDISTGTCNSLYRHGWMTLNADYTGLDLSETMLLQGQELMAKRQVAMDFVLGDATQLPLQSEFFDIVLNYGALNGFANPKLALEDMARVTKKGGLVLFLDEQLYESASFVERLYFKTVLSSHNVIHHCPVELMPESLGTIKVHQVYHFYYLCTSYKK
jgi:ubiquinone/menaquinone biosynthesis C-methylase UbiE